MFNNRNNRAVKAPLIVAIIVLICVTVFVSYYSPSRHMSCSITPDIWPASRLDTMSSNELEDLFHGSLKSTHCTCHQKTRVGNVGDGGWYVCDDVGYKPEPPCLTYSFDIGYDYSFDLQMKSLYGCEVHSFDPHIFHHHPSLNFHSIGIKHFTKNDQRFMTLGDIRKHLNHSNRSIEILKINIEEGAYISLRKAIEDGELEDVKQLMIEFHVKASKLIGARNIHRVALLLIKQLIRNGFRIYFVERNSACNYINYKKEELTRCYTVYWVKVS